MPTFFEITNAKIKEIEEQMARTQKNKATNAHLGLLKAKLSKLKNDLVCGPKTGGPQSKIGFDVKKSGDCRVGMIGFPSVGKSTLLTKMTGTESKAADYEFTTLTCIPGALKYKGCKIQLLDLPGIIEGAKDNKGRGRQVIGVARTCDLLLIVLDASRTLGHKRIVEKELFGFGIRLNKKKPNIRFTRSEKGGIRFINSGQCEHLNQDIVEDILKTYKINNAEVQVYENNTIDDLIDVVQGNRAYIPALYVLNKIDKVQLEDLDLLCKIPHYVPISARDEWNFSELLEKMWEYLGMLRIYTKPKGQIPDYENPIVIPKDACTVKDFCMRIHKTILDEFKFARVWGTSALHQPQNVGIKHELEDEDIVQLVKGSN